MPTWDHPKASSFERRMLTESNPVGANCVGNNATGGDGEKGLSLSSGIAHQTEPQTERTSLLLLEAERRRAGNCHQSVMFCSRSSREVFSINLILFNPHIEKCFSFIFSFLSVLCLVSKT